MGIEAPVGVPAVSPIVNEGPVGPNFRLENTMPLTINRFNLLGEIKFTPLIGEVKQIPVEPTIVPPILEEAFDQAWKRSDPLEKARSIYEELREQPALTGLEVDRLFRVAEAMGKSRRFYGWEEPSQTWLGSEVGVRAGIAQAQRTPETKTVNQGTQILSYPFTQPVLTEQITKEEKVAVVQRNKESSQNLEEEEVNVEKRKYVLDENALSQRIIEIVEAVRKAKEFALKLGLKINGRLVARFLPGQHPGNESEAVRGKGPDGSIPETKDSIEGQGEFASDSEAEVVSIKIVHEKPPVKVRENGERVGKEDVSRVFKDRVKPKSTEFVVNIFRKRQVKKVPVPVSSMADNQVEQRIEDYPQFAGVFPKTA